MKQQVGHLQSRRSVLEEAGAAVSPAVSVEAAPVLRLPDAAIARWAERLEGESPERVLEWAVERLGRRITFATGFGAEGCAIIDMIARRQLPIDIFTLDTGLFFEETYDLWRRLEMRYDITIRGVTSALTLEQQAEAYGDRLWQRDPDRCCYLRKVLPLRQTLGGFDGWISAIRRDQSPSRQKAAVIERDATFGLLKINPLVRWTTADIWAYLKHHDVPFNGLYERGFTSIGCAPCTSPVAVGEDERAGRWRGTGKMECGLHNYGARTRERVGKGPGTRSDALTQLRAAQTGDEALAASTNVAAPAMVFAGEGEDGYE